MFVGSDPPWFAFLIHPRDIGDLYRWPGSRLLRDNSRDEAEFVAKVHTMEPMALGEVVFGIGGPRGELITVLRLPERLLWLGGERVVAEAVAVAAARGCRVVGLGALTAPVTNAGLTLMRRLPPGITVTTGNAYTAAVARADVVAAAATLDLRRPARVAVLGATGSVGVPASHLLVRAGFEVTLIGRTEERLRMAFGDLAGQAHFATGPEGLRAADIVLILTSDPSSQVTADSVADGAIIIDVAQPANIPAERFPEFHARGIRVAAGGLVHIPGYRSTADFNLDDPTSTFACLAETYVMARAGIREHSVGPIAVEHAERMERIAAWHDVRPAPLSLTLPVPTANDRAQSDALEEVTP